MKRNEIIKDLLRRCGLKQWELADRRRISEMGLSRLLRGDLDDRTFQSLLADLKALYDEQAIQDGAELLTCAGCGTTQLVFTYLNPSTTEAGQHPRDESTRTLVEAGWLPNMRRFAGEDEWMCPRCVERDMESAGGCK